MSIVWSTELRKLHQLIPFESNPRTLSEKQASDLAASIEKFGYVETIAINRDNTILAGHMRWKTLIDKGWDECEVRVPSRLLTPDEAKEYLIRSNRNTGEWDYDILANEFDYIDLLDWGFEKSDLGISVSMGDFGEEKEEPLPKCSMCGHKLRKKK